MAQLKSIDRKKFCIFAVLLFCFNVSYSTNLKISGEPKWYFSPLEQGNSTFRSNRIYFMATWNKIPRNEYSNIHMWIKKHYGKAHKCENVNCKSPNATIFHWALKQGYFYKKDVNNFMQLCIKCHRNYDMNDDTRKAMSKRAIKNLDKVLVYFKNPLIGKSGAENMTSKPIVRISKDGSRKEYVSLTQAASELFGHKKTSNISQCLTKKVPTAYGYKWEYKATS